MTNFRIKTVGPRDALGSIFREKRTERYLSVGAVSRATGIARQYVEAIENGRYDALPGLVYGKSFVRAYSQHLGLAQAPLVRAFTEEYVMATAGREEKKRFVPSQPRILVTPARVRIALACVLIGVLGGYVGGEVTRLLRPPEVSLSAPTDASMVTTSTVEVVGNAETEARITVNDAYVSNDGGVFRATVDLQEGVNTITVRAFRRHGRDRVITRTVVRTRSEGTQAVSRSK